MKVTDANDAPRKRLYTVREFCQVTGYSSAYAYVLMSKGLLGYCQIGATRRIPVEAVDEFIASTRVDARGA